MWHGSVDINGTVIKCPDPRYNNFSLTKHCTGQIWFSFSVKLLISSGKVYNYFVGRVPTLFQEKSALEKIHSLGRNRLFKPKKKVESRLYFYL